MTKILGPLVCIRCHRLVFWDRVGTVYRLMERPVGWTYPRLHACKP